MNPISRIFQRAYHLGQRVVREANAMPKQWRAFGAKVALEIFLDALIPPGKSPRYIAAIERKVDEILAPVVEKYKDLPEEAIPMEGKIPVWCCWWQGVDQMPELAKMCHERLKQVLPENAELHVITLDNFKEYVDMPQHILDKFDRKIITMTTMSDVLRFQLLARYGGYWLDSTVFFTDGIPDDFFSGQFHCQRMVGNTAMTVREACRGNWCGFSMAGSKNSIVFRYMNDAFSYWWEHYDTIIDYVLIDYILWTGFRHIPAIHDVIDAVPDNNPDIFEMYKVLNEPYTPELYARVTKNNTLHKLTYKMDLSKETPVGEMTLYGYLLNEVYGKRGEKMATFSVIVPVYNAAKTVERCVDSLVRSGGDDLQIILIEDSSKDNSWEICQRLAEKYKSVIALHNEHNSGVSHARNQGLDAATGTYLLFCDSDDYWDEDYVASFRAVVEAGHDFAICSYVNHDEVANGRTDIIGFEATETAPLRPHLKDIYDKTLLQQLWNKVFRADLIKENDIRFDESISIGEDLRFILDYIRLGDVQEVTLIDQPLYHYMRDQAGSLMYRVGYESIEEPLKNMAALYRLMGMEESEIETQINAQRSRQIDSYAYLIMHNMGMPLLERKRLIHRLSPSCGQILFRHHFILYCKEKIARLLK